MEGPPFSILFTFLYIFVFIYTFRYSYVHVLKDAMTAAYVQRNEYCNNKQTAVTVMGFTGSGYCVHFECTSTSLSRTCMYTYIHTFVTDSQI